MYSIMSKYCLPVLVVIGLIYSFISVITPTPESVSDAQWDEVEKIITENNKNEALIIVHPAWEDSGLKHFKDYYIVLGQPNNGIHEYYQEVWVVLTHDSPEPDYLDKLKINFRKSMDDIELLRYVDIDAEHILYDFYYNIEKGKTQLISRKESRDCTYKDEKWVCPIRDWNYLGKRSVQIGKKWQHAIWMHPLKNWTTSSTFKDVPMGKRLVGEYALADKAAELKDGAPVDFVIKINGVEKARLKTKRTYGWHNFEIDTSKIDGKREDVTFEVTAKKDGLRHFCFMARTRNDVIGSPRSKMPDKPVPVVDKPEKDKEEVKKNKQKQDEIRKKVQEDKKKKEKKASVKKENTKPLNKAKPANKAGTRGRKLDFNKAMKKNAQPAKIEKEQGAKK